MSLVIEFQLTRSRGAWLATQMLVWSVSAISTHTLTWSVTISSGYQKRFWEFQLTRSRGAWHLWMLLLLCFPQFQLTRSRGAWQTVLYLSTAELYFNSHAHVERDYRLTRLVWKRSHFNSHAHVERDQWQAEFEGAMMISTHTLTWSVTYIYKIIQ